MGIAPIFAVLATIVAGWGVIKRYKTHMVLVFAGLAMITAAILCGETNVLRALSGKTPASTGNVWFDVVDLLRRISMNQCSGIGLTIMAAGGFSAYMGAIGASDSLVRLCLIPLRGIKRPYVTLPLAYWLGALCYLVIPSAGGLSMLLLVAVFPVLIGIGITRPAAAAVIATCSALSMGPASGVSILAAQTAGMDPAVFMVKCQIPVAIPALILLPLLHVIMQPYFDRKGGEVQEAIQDVEGSIKEAPLWYALFPVLPIILLVVFSPLVYTKMRLNTIAALYLVWLVVMLIEIIRHKGDLKKSFNDGFTFFQGMGKMFVTIVALIIAAEMFAAGLKISGLIDLMLSGANAGGFGIKSMTAVLCGINGMVAFLTGSNVGSFSAFVSLSTSLAPALGGTIEQMVTPMNYVGSLMRSMSPVAGVMIICAGAGGISTFALARRTCVPVLVSILATVIISFVFFEGGMYVR